jgi:hypothetical protein
MKGLALAALACAVAVACARHSPPTATWEARMRKADLVNELWVQIRDWRRKAALELDPPSTLAVMFRDKSVSAAKAVCPDAQATAPTCEEMCSLAESICDNAETICQIADELGKDDPAQDTCASAKASCREAKQRCCNCNANPPTPSGRP